jgi:DNA repair protein RecN (Recombination protein N)
MTVAGGGRQFANGSPCTLSVLREVGDLLVDLHGPHDHQSLFSRDQQVVLLDAFAGVAALRGTYGEARRKWQRLEAEQRQIGEGAEALAREVELLEHQSGEIAAASLDPAEEEQLLQRQKTASHGRRLGEICSEILALAGESDDAVTARLTELSRLAREMERLDPSAGGVAAGAAAVFESLQDLVRSVERYAGGISSDPAQLAAVEARLDLIQSLKRKYGATVGDVMAFGERAAARLAELRGREERGAGLGAEIASAREDTLAMGGKLSRARAAAAPKLASLVRKHLADLGFAKAGFSLRLSKLGEPGAHGLEEVEFLFAPNPGEPEQALRAIASSGEISRVMLALKTSLAAQDSIPILIFDEIDANVGGEVGSKIGVKMRELGLSHQVFCITHLPQVAALAGSQFVVRKDTSGERTSTSLVEVAGDDRVGEIARMLGGKESSALAHARELLAAP